MVHGAWAAASEYAESRLFVLYSRFYFVHVLPFSQHYVMTTRTARYLLITTILESCVIALGCVLNEPHAGVWVLLMTGSSNFRPLRFNKPL